MADGGRVYGGRSEAERRSERRDRLTAAGLELFGTQGYAATTIERLCAEAGVATRSFYEEFSSREDLLAAVYRAVVEGTHRAVLSAVQTPPDPEGRVRAGVAAYVGHLTDDPRRAQVAHREVRRESDLEPQRQAALVSFAGLLADHARLPRPGGEPGQGRVLALALAGAASEVMADWVAAGPPRPPTAPLTAGLTRLYLAALSQDDA